MKDLEILINPRHYVVPILHQEKEGHYSTRKVSPILFLIKFWDLFIKTQNIIKYSGQAYYENKNKLDKNKKSSIFPYLITLIIWHGFLMYQLFIFFKSLGHWENIITVE